MRKTLLTLFIAFLLPLANVKGQDLSWAIHISNPLAALPYAPPKIRVKGEVRIDSFNSLLLCYTHYWVNIADVIFDAGYMVGMEYRRYMPQHRRSENYLYGETGAGNQDFYYAYSWDHNNRDVLAIYLGAGVGRHINFNHFFIDINAGLRGTYLSTRDYSPSYYQAGPGAIVRINGSFGFQSAGRIHERQHHEEEF